MTTSPGPLAGVLVIDLSTTFMGPYCSLLMAQLGARVIKVEPPQGDIVRYIEDERGEGLGPIFLNVTRGKESVVLDLKQPHDRDMLDRLIDRCDVFLHNMRPAAMRRLRLDEKSILERNPRAVYCHTVGFGSKGPYRDKPAYDDVVQAASGMAALQAGTGDPQYVRQAVADKVVAIMALSAVLAALHERHSSGFGQAVEVPMFESMVAFTLLEQQGSAVYSPRKGPMGYSRTQSPFRKPYRTADGYISVLVYTDVHWQSFFEIVARPDLAADPRFATITNRTTHIDELYRLVEEALMNEPTDIWLELFDEYQIPAMPVQQLDDLLVDEHLQAVGLLEEEFHPVAGDLLQPRLPWTYSRTSSPRLSPAPRLGEHTQRVLREFGP